MDVLGGAPLLVVFGTNGLPHGWVLFVSTHSIPSSTCDGSRCCARIEMSLISLKSVVKGDEGGMIGGQNMTWKNTTVGTLTQSSSDLKGGLELGVGI